MMRRGKKNDAREWNGEKSAGRRWRWKRRMKKQEREGFSGASVVRVRARERESYVRGVGGDVGR